MNALFEESGWSSRLTWARWLGKQPDWPQLYEQWLLVNYTRSKCECLIKIQLAKKREENNSGLKWVVAWWVIYDWNLSTVNTLFVWLLVVRLSLSSSFYLFLYLNSYICLFSTFPLSLSNWIFCSNLDIICCSFIVPSSGVALDMKQLGFGPASRWSLVRVFIVANFAYDL